MGPALACLRVAKSSRDNHPTARIKVSHRVTSPSPSPFPSVFGVASISGSPRFSKTRPRAPSWMRLKSCCGQVPVGGWTHSGRFGRLKGRWDRMKWPSESTVSLTMPVGNAVRSRWSRAWLSMVRSTSTTGLPCRSVNRRRMALSARTVERVARSGMIDSGRAQSALSSKRASQGDSTTSRTRPARPSLVTSSGTAPGAKSYSSPTSAWSTKRLRPWYRAPLALSYRSNVPSAWSWTLTRSFSIQSTPARIDPCFAAPATAFGARVPDEARRR